MKEKYEEKKIRKSEGERGEREVKEGGVVPIYMKKKKNEEGGGAKRAPVPRMCGQQIRIQPHIFLDLLLPIIKGVFKLQALIVKLSLKERLTKVSFFL